MPIIGKLKSSRGSMAVYVTIVILSMLIILLALFFTSNSVRRNQLITVMKLKQAYESDNGRADEIYADLTDGKANDDTEVYIQNGLILHYDGINNTGNGHSSTATTWKDLSGKGNDGTFSLSPTTSTFYWESNCIILSNNTNALSSYVDTPVNLNGKERTIIYTVDATNLTGSMWGDTNSSNTSGLFCYQNFVANRGRSSSLQSRYNYTFNKSGIYTYAVTLSSSELKFYENGVLVTTISNTVGLNTSGNMRLLAARYSSQNATNLKMYNFLIYDRVLSDAEIQSVYQTTKSEHGF